MMCRALVAIVIGMLLSKSLYAEDMPLWEMVNGWGVYVDTTLSDSCFVVQAYEEGTALRLGFNTVDENGYIMLGNEQWRSLEVGKAYDLELQLDQEIPWEATASVGPIGGTNFLVVYFTDFDLLTEIAERHTFTVKFQGKNIAKLSLRGSYAALEEMIRCQRLVNEAKENSDPFDEGNGEDPFAEEQETSTDDPFAM